jgi:hypothetical protein
MGKKSKQDEKVEQFLDPQIIKNFRLAINASEVFYSDKEHKAKWSLICAVMDRVTSCVEYLDKTNKDIFDTEEEFVHFLTFCSIIKDAIKELLQQANIDYPFKESKKYLQGIFNRFMELYKADRPQYKDVASPTDDKFFEFLRSLAFAHPLETNRAAFIEHGETLYSPFVLVNRIIGWDIKNPVGLNIYSNKIANTMHLWFSLDTIKAYIKSRYELLDVATQWVNKTIKDFESEWSKRKVNRSLTPIETLKDIKEILAARYKETYSIDEAISYLECQNTDKDNKKAVKEYKDNIIKYLPQLCDWIDRLQDDECEPHGFFNAVSGYPNEMHAGASYQLEKIFSYLDEKIIDLDRYLKNREYFIRTSDDSKMCNFEWGLVQAEFFSNSLAGNMSSLICKK